MGYGENEWSEVMLKPKLTEHPDGTKKWWLDGKRHRVDGPAIERPNGTKEWYLNGKLWTVLRQPRDNAGQVWWVMAKMSGAK